MCMTAESYTFLHGGYSETHYRCVYNLAKRISKVPRNKADLSVKSDAC